MAFKLPSLRVKPMESVPLDASRTLFRVGTSSKVSDLLHALPMMKGTVVGEGPTAGGGAFNMFVDVQRAGTLATPTYYDNTGGLTAMTTVLAAKTRFPVARLGLDFPALAVDSVATATNTAENPYWQCYAAAFAILRQLDKTCVQGTGTGVNNPTDFLGLQQFCANTSRTVASGTSLETDVRSIMALITPNGSGTGEGVHCLIGGPTVLRKLMATASGQNGQSGYRVDPRSGRFAYHYQGVPYYKAEALESAGVGRLYAANLGPSGLTLVHGYGEPETFGLAVDEQPITTTTGSRQVTVHGAWALVFWETEAVYELSGINITTGL